MKADRRWEKKRTESETETAGQWEEEKKKNPTFDQPHDKWRTDEAALWEIRGRKEEVWLRMKKRWEDTGPGYSTMITAAWCNDLAPNESTQPSLQQGRILLGIRCLENTCWGESLLILDRCKIKAGLVLYVAPLCISLIMHTLVYIPILCNSMHIIDVCIHLVQYPVCANKSNLHIPVCTRHFSKQHLVNRTLASTPALYNYSVIFGPITFLAS